MYSKKFGTEMEKLRKRFWGDSFYDAKAKKWKIENTSDEGKELKRAFA
jgi:elongation factor 2